MLMPLIGLGTGKLQGTECEKILATALDLGYRHIDTADSYQNHQAISRAICSFPREKLFITTKLLVSNLAPKEIIQNTKRFLKELQTDYLDLLLIHWPPPLTKLPSILDVMFSLQKKGLIRSMGVSNFVRCHLPILSHYPIATNQIELHPYFQRKTLVEAYKKQRIAITAYRPLAKGAFAHDPILERIGKTHRKTACQVALRWLTQQEICVIPKAGDQKHLKENLSIFDFVLSPLEMEQIAKLDQGKRFCAPDPSLILED